MRVFGQRSPLDVFRLDLVYLIAALLAEEDKPPVQALATPLTAVLAELRGERGTLEQAEELLVTQQALRGNRDGKTDDRTIEIGGVARAAHQEIYKILFPDLSPSQIADLALEKQLGENERILGILQTLEPTHSLRLAYESDLAADIDALRKASTSVKQANTALQLAQSRITQLKAKIDMLRVQTHGELLKIFGNKDDAERFYRKSRAVPSKDQSGGEEAEPAQGADA